ncbi:DGQHR domain [[Eubacterium] siraeum V10Sc8a]|jgi:DNA sulfur modification protein DndB|uniref:DGQHR domain n=2 Tax=Oscillospiraceae TaxID=216572 RepID=D4MKG5_9FIRM|nr:DGQHR domain [[Eubacterium] siraeum V10Sc8a]
MTNWENIVSGKELITAKNKRKNLYIEARERKVALEELEEEGWEYVKDYADSKFVKVRKEKPFYERFEDQIWLLFFQMGFKLLNRDANFKMNYDFNNPDFTQQIDVFAADDETILIVECKSSEDLNEVQFKKDIEKLHGQMEGLRKCALKQYPGRKVKFIWATHNCIMSAKDIKRLQEWDIIFFSDSTIQYYSELVKHLGTCSRYQLLGNLLANTEIKKMQNKVLAIKGKMGGHEYYEFSIEPEKLLKIGYVLHRNEANKNMMPTYQRIIKRKRLKEVQSFINDGGYFPNSIIISIDSGGRKLQFDESPTKLDDSISKIGVLHLPKRYHSAYIIDGQHRLYGYSDSEYANTNSIPIVAFVDLDRSEQLKLFMDINENQKSVSKTLRITLNSDMLWDSPNQNERRDAIRSKIAQMCGEEQSSPLLGRVVIGEDEKNNIKCITIQAIQLALQKCSFFSTFAKNNTIATNGSFDVGDNQATIDRFYPFLEGCFKTVKNECETEWSLGEQGILTINRGIQGIIRIINDVVNLLIAQNKLFPLTQDIDDIINEVEYYMSPLLNHINKLTEEQRIELKSFYGGGAENKYLRYFQKVIHDSLTDFNPEGLEEYIENTTKEYNATSKEYIYAIEEKLKDVIAESLQEYYGDKWLIKGLPKTTYKEAEKAASDKNYELLSNDEESDIEPWDCISLSDCKDIVVYSHNWSEIFESIITRPEDLILSTKEQKTEWISTISKEQNKLSKSTYSVPKSSFELISNIYAWLVGTD